MSCTGWGRCNGRNARRVMETGKKRTANQQLVLWMLGKGYNEREVKPSNGWVSRRKQSTLCILSIPAFVQPSSLITASTNWRRDSIYSGLERRRYNTCVIVYWHAHLSLRVSPVGFCRTLGIFTVVTTCSSFACHLASEGLQ